MTQRKTKRPGSTTRRQFLAGAAPTAAAAAAFGRTGLFAQEAATIESIRIPDEIAASLDEEPREGSFEGNGLTGAEVFARLCKKEGLAAMFCCPGNYTVTHAIAAAGVPSYGGRTETNMAAAADGYARATGDVVACSGTEGPGFTNMVTSVAAAHYARTPLLVLSEQRALGRGGSRGRDPGDVPTADHRGDQEVRQAHDPPQPGTRVRSVCVPPAQDRRPGPGAPRLPRARWRGRGSGIRAI